jgi:hypothetical protein
LNVPVEFSKSYPTLGDALAAVSIVTFETEAPGFHQKPTVNALALVLPGPSARRKYAALIVAM